MKKSNIITLLIIILILITLITVLTPSNNVREIKVGDGYFTLPIAYAEAAPNKDGDLEINNATNSIYLSEEDKPLNDCMSEYINSTLSTNRTVEQHTINENGITIYKVSVSDGFTVHYWFELDGHTFTMYSWDGNSHLDQEVKNLVKSAHT